MLETAAVKAFWNWFVEQTRRQDDCDRNSFLQDLANQTGGELARLSPSIAAEFSSIHGGYELTLTAQGVRRFFPDVRQIAAEFPALAGWRVQSLRPVQTPKTAYSFEGLQAQTAQLRVHAVPVLSQFGVLLLLRGVEISDYVVFRNLGKRIVMDIVGEERFGLFVTDVQVMDHADCEAGGDGAISQPLPEIASIIPAAPSIRPQFGQGTLAAVQANRLQDFRRLA